MFWRNELTQTTKKIIQPQELRQRLQRHISNSKRRDHTHAAQIQSTEDKVDKVNSKYMFLSEALGWKEDIDGMDDAISDADPSGVTNLDKYLFFAE